MTPILKIIAEYCDMYVDDIRLRELSASNPPLYARQMYGYLKPALSNIDIPEDIPMYIFGVCNEKVVEPIYDSTNYVFTETATEDVTIELGYQYIGYELYHCHIRKDNNGCIEYIPIKTYYDEYSGIVRVPATPEHPIIEGTELEFDFYSDGFFKENFSSELLSIIGTAFQLQWLERFTTDYLSLVPKVEDKSFYEQNRANKENADTTKIIEVRRVLSDKMRRYAENQAIRRMKGRIR